MKKYLLILIILLFPIPFYAADVGQIDLNFVDEDPQNIKIDERYPTLYKFLGETINEFNRGNLEQKYNILLKLVNSIKFDASYKEIYTGAQLYKIVDELNELINALEIAFPADKIQNLRMSVYSLTLIASKYV